MAPRPHSDVVALVAPPVRNSNFPAQQQGHPLDARAPETSKRRVVFSQTSIEKSVRSTASTLPESSLSAWVTW